MSGISGIDSIKNITGMASLLDDDMSIDIDDIERQITQSGSVQKKEPQHNDIAAQLSKELDSISRKMNIPLAQLESADDRPSRGFAEDNRGRGFAEDKYSRSHEDNNDLDFDTLFNLDAVAVSSGKSGSSGGLDSFNRGSSSIGVGAGGVGSGSSGGFDSYTRDAQYVHLTEEEKRRSHVNDVMSRYNTFNESAPLDREEEAEQMAILTEQIDNLRTNLEGEGVNLSRVPEVTANTTIREANNILSMLRIKNDRQRYCDLTEEIIIAFAYGLEGVFDGKREVLGSRIDLTGYSDTIKVKLRRMRNDTSTFITSLMQSYHISGGWRLLLELVPSLFLYSRERKNKSGENLVSDEAYQKALTNLT